MALQMAVSLALAFVIGQALWPLHWSWVVLTAYIVASGNRGRGEVLHKSGLRVLGAASGAVIATLLAGLFSPGEPWLIVAIFVVMALSLVLRDYSYAYWAAGVTGMLSLLYGYLGVHADNLILERIGAIMLGALIAVVCAWFITPVRSGDVLRLRASIALANLSDWITAARRQDFDTMQTQLGLLSHSLAQLQQLSPTFRTHHQLARLRLAPRRGADRHELIEQIVRYGDHAAELTEMAAANPGILGSPEFTQELTGWHEEVTAARRSLKTPAATS